MKNLKIFNNIKKAMLLVISASILTSCGENPLYQEYGTIQKFLDHGKKYSFNWINSNIYTNKIGNEKCFDAEGIIFNLLYDINYKEITKEKASISIQEDEYIEYSIPFDDAAYIYLKSNGAGFINVSPDLHLGLIVYIQVEQQMTDVLFDAANTLLTSFIEKQ